MCLPGFSIRPGTDPQQYKATMGYRVKMLIIPLLHAVEIEQRTHDPYSPALFSTSRINWPFL